jgi:two-component sensor histidine kinase
VEQVVVTLGLLQQQLSVVGSGPAFRLFLAEQACLWRSLGAEQGVDMRIDVDEIEVAADKAVPLALILNELVMNCLEHAFPGGRGGTIHIELKRSGEDQGALTVADDGIGVPGSGRVRGSLGLTLIERLSEQTGGSFSIERTDGTIARIHFPLR